MNRKQPYIRSFFSACLVLAIATNVAPADEVQDVPDRLLEAWEKYTEVQECSAAYAERSEIANAIQQGEQERSELLTTIHSLRVELDNYPSSRRWRTNQQEEVYQAWLACRQQLNGLDSTLNNLRFRLREMDERALQQAAMNGQRVKATNRRDLVNEYSRLQRECLDAFGALKKAADATAAKSGRSREEVIRQAMEAEEGPRKVAHRLSPPPPFLAAFKTFCTGGRMAQPARTKPAGKSRARRPVR